VILRYKLETVMESCGNFSASVTFREKIGTVLELLNEAGKSAKNGWDSLIKKAGLGHFLKLTEDNWKHGCGNLLHFFLLRQIKCNKKNSFWFLIGNKPIKFGMREFCLVTGLKCSPCPRPEDTNTVVEKGWDFVLKLEAFVKKERVREQENLLKAQLQKMQKSKGKGIEKKGKVAKVKSGKVFAEDLINVVSLKSTKEFSLVDKSRCAAVYLVHSVILGEQDSKCVSTDILAMSANPDFFAAFPWGRWSYDKLLSQISKDFKSRAEDRRKAIEKGAPSNVSVKYNVSGFWQAFIVSFFHL
jgi:Domain of unknown function (DUF1985)